MDDKTLKIIEKYAYNFHNLRMSEVQYRDILIDMVNEINGECKHVFKCEKCGFKTWYESYTSGLAEHAECCGSTRWQPKDNQHYFLISSTGKIEGSTWNNQSHDLARWKVNNCYQTIKEVEKHQKLVLEAYK